MLGRLVVLIIALVAGVLMTAGHALGSPPRSQLLVVGWVTDANGEGVAGATVSAYYSSTTETQEQQSPISNATTGVDGYFELFKSVATGDTAAADASGGWVNFDVVATSGSLLTYSGISRSPNISSNTWAGNNIDAASTDAGVASAMSASAGQLNLDIDKTNRGRSVSSSESTSTQAAAIGCIVVTTAVNSSDKYTVIGQMHLGKDQRATFTYGRKADSDIGIGYSTNNSTWSINGTRHVGTSKDNAVFQNKSTLNSTLMFGKKLTSEFHYVKYKHQCGIQRWWTIKATRWNTGMLYGDDTSQFNGHCNDTYFQYQSLYSPGSGYSRFTNNFANYAGAATAFGVSLTAQSGASDYVRSDWTFGTKYPQYYLCGNDAKPPNAHRIYAGA
jgi:hypothetical protein